MMGKTSNIVKQNWNAQNYSQIKVSVKPDIAASFKSACESAGLSMSGVLSNFMADFSGTPVLNSARLKPIGNYSSMQKRRSAVKRILAELELIKKAEELFLDNAPPNLLSAPVFVSSEEYISLLDDAIAILGEAY